MPTAQSYAQLAHQIAVEQFGDTPLAGTFERMMRQESAGFDPEVVEGRRRSSAGAAGIAQLMPAHWTAVNPLDPEAALRYGAKYLASNIATFGGDVAKGVAAYNAGPGNVQKAVAQGGAGWVSALPGETQSYLSITKPEGGAQSAAASGAPAQAQGKGPTPGYVFPVPGYSGALNLHHGEFPGAADIMVPRGSPVVAMRAGTVISVGSAANGNPGGNNVTVQGDDGNMYYYAHFDAPAVVKEGQPVTAGTALGVVGDSGNAKGTGTHLHLGIGPSIISGTGPTGGAGKDYNAIGLLQHVQSGQTGQAAMTNQPRQDPTMAAMAKAAQARYDAAVASETAARDAVSKAAPGIAQIAAQQALDAATKAVEGAGTYLINVTKAAQPAAGDSPLATATGIAQMYGTYAGIGNQNFQNQLGLGNAQSGALNQGFQNQLGLASALGGAQNQDFTNAVTTANTLFGFTRAMFGDNVALAGVVQGILEGNRKNVLDLIGLQLQKGEIDLNGAIAKMSAIDKAQTTELARSGQVLQRADFIRKATMENATRLLPPGTMEQPGWEATSPANQVLGRLGINPMVLKVNQVPLADLDPLNQLAKAEQSLTDGGVPRAAGAYAAGIQGIDAAQGRNQALTVPAPSPITPDAVGLPGAAPNYQQMFGGAVPGRTNIAGTLDGVAAPNLSKPLDGITAPKDDLSQYAILQQIFGISGGTGSGAAPAKPATPTLANPSGLAQGPQPNPVLRFDRPLQTPDALDERGNPVGQGRTPTAPTDASVARAGQQGAGEGLPTGGAQGYASVADQVRVDGEDLIINGVRFKGAAKKAPVTQAPGGGGGGGFGGFVSGVANTVANTALPLGSGR